MGKDGNISPLYELDLRVKGTLRGLIEKALIYPDISTFMLTKEQLYSLQRFKSVRTEFGEIIFKDYVPFVSADGTVIKALYCIYNVVEGGHFRVDYDSGTGLLVSKEIAFRLNQDIIYVRIWLIGPIENANVLTVSERYVGLLRYFALIITVGSIVTLAIHNRYKVL